MDNGLKSQVAFIYWPAGFRWFPVIHGGPEAGLQLRDLAQHAQRPSHPDGWAGFQPILRRRVVRTPRVEVALGSASLNLPGGHADVN